LAAAAVVVLVGCPSSSSTGPGPNPPESPPPPGVTFQGGTFGGECSGRYYTDAGTGYAFCFGSVWAYTTVDPSTDGFGKLIPQADGGFTSPCDAPCSCGACSGQGQ
jgi:hypothetical protein